MNAVKGMAQFEVCIVMICLGVIFILGFAMSKEIHRGTVGFLESDQNYLVSTFVESLEEKEEFGKTLIAREKLGGDEKYYGVGVRCASTIPLEISFPIKLVTKRGEDGLLNCLWIPLIKTPVFSEKVVNGE